MNTNQDVTAQDMENIRLIDQVNLTRPIILRAFDADKLEKELKENPKARIIIYLNIDLEPNETIDQSSLDYFLNLGVREFIVFMGCKYRGQVEDTYSDYKTVVLDKDSFQPKGTKMRLLIDQRVTKGYDCVSECLGMMCMRELGKIRAKMEEYGATYEVVHAKSLQDPEFIKEASAFLNAKQDVWYEEEIVKRFRALGQEFFNKYQTISSYKLKDRIAWEDIFG